MTSVPFSLRERWLLAAIAVAVVLTAGSLSLWREVHLAESRLVDRAQQAAVAFDQAVAEGKTLTSALYGFYHSTGEMPAERFPVLIERFLAAHPQLGWAGYATRVDPGEVAEFEEYMEMEGFMDFKIHGADTPNLNGPTRYHLAVNLLEPLSPLAGRTLGLDLLANAEWRDPVAAAVAEARVTGSFGTDLTGKGLGYLLTRPTYRGTVEPDDIIERQRQLAGLILIYLRADKLAAIATAGMDELKASVVPRPATPRELREVAHLEAGGLKHLSMRVAVPVTVAGRTHHLQVESQPELTWTPVFVNMLISLAALSIIYFALRARRLSEIVEKASVEKAMIAEVTLSSVGDAVIRANEAGVVHYLNPKAKELLLQTDYDVDEPVHFDALFEVKDRRGRLLDWDALKDAVRNDERLWLNSPNAADRVVSCNMSQVLTEDTGDKEGLVLAIRDVTVEFELAQELEYQARHDPLTGLPNRREFERQLRDMVAAHGAAIGEEASVLYLDLDQFKLVNDTCGHAAGDQMLSQLAGLLAAMVGAPNVLARLGGDEFGVLVKKTNPSQAAAFAQKLCDAVAAYRFVWEERVFELGASVGVVHLSARSGTAEDVLRAADLACFAAKDLGRNRYHVYHHDDRTIARNEGEMIWQEEVKRAMGDDRFVLHGQPIHALASQAHDPRLCELLVRMYARDGQLAPPMSFIPAAERYGLMPQLDREVIRLAFQHIAFEQPRRPGQLTYTINLSGQSMADPGLGNYILQAARKVALAPERVCFEITETSAISNLNNAQQLMHRLRDRGFQFALDDFGAGLSSFRYLKQLPVNYLKIDGQFIKDIEQDPVAQTMVDSIVQVACVLNVRTIGEMVENESTRQQLCALGVDYAQGFHLGRPAELVSPVAVARIA